MEFSKARRRLEELGWSCNGDTLMSPAGGFWFDRQTLEADAIKVYAPAARRAYSSLTLPQYRMELHELLEVLEGDAAMTALAAHIHGVQAAVASWAPRHGLTVSSWDFGYAAVRATARHPIGGVAAIECLVDAPPNVETFAFHWIDDYTYATRRGRSTRFQAERFNDADLLRTLDEAVRVLLEPRTPTAYQTSTLSVDEQCASDEAKHWAAYQILR